MNWNAVLADWDERWRYPSLLVELAYPGGTADDRRYADRLLDGIAVPVTDPGEAVAVLLERGEFGVAQRLAEGGLFRDDAASDLIEQVSAAEQATVGELARRRDGLVQRMRRAGSSESPPPMSALPRERRAAAVNALDEWEREHLLATEAELKARLERSLAARDPDSHGEWAAAVRGCLDAGEFPAAERLLEDGPSADVPGGPASVPRWTRWPWSDRHLPEILRWYHDGAAPPGFPDRWRPPEQDRTAPEMLRALEELHRQCDLDSVREFATALDDALGAGRLPHSVTPVGEGFLTHLVAVSDYRLPWIALPKKVPLYVGPPGWAPPEGPAAVWFVPAVGVPGALPGVAALDATAIFRLVAPTGTGRPSSPAVRRANLLREVCRRLRVADVLGEDTATAQFPTSAHETRDAIAWCLDLLGVHPGLGVTDALLYDTGAYPRALRVALEQLAPDGRRPLELIAEDLALWRRDRAAMEKFHRRVLAPIFADREVAVLLHIALMTNGEQPDALFTVDDLSQYLAVHPSSDDLISLPAAAHRTITGVLLEARGPDGYGWSRPGLAALLGAVDVEALLNDDFDELVQRRSRTIKSADLELQNLGLTSAMHQVKTGVFAVKNILVELTGRRGEHQDQLDRAVALIADLDDVWALSEPEGATNLLRRKVFDLRELLRGRWHQFDLAHRDIEIAFRADGADAPLVWGSRPLLRLALDNLINNGARAAEATRDGECGHVRLSCGIEPHEPGRPPAWARIDIEDSGPGIPPEIRRELLNPNGERVSEHGGGVGFRHAMDHIAYNGGVLDILDRPSDLGGTHLAIRLPLTGTHNGQNG